MHRPGSVTRRVCRITPCSLPSAPAPKHALESRSAPRRGFLKPPWPLPAITCCFQFTDHEPHGPAGPRPLHAQACTLRCSAAPHILCRPPGRRRTLQGRAAPASIVTSCLLHRASVDHLASERQRAASTTCARHIEPLPARSTTVRVGSVLCCKGQPALCCKGQPKSHSGGLVYAARRRSVKGQQPGPKPTSAGSRTVSRVE